MSGRCRWRARRSSSRTAGGNQDSGSGTMLVVVQATVLLFLGVALAAVAAVVHQHRVAQAAADLSALAGARVLADGGHACAGADRIARANQAELDRCRVLGRDVRVRVRVPPPAWPPWLPDLPAEARAGPADRALSLAPPR